MVSSDRDVVLDYLYALGRGQIKPYDDLDSSTEDIDPEGLSESDDISADDKSNFTPTEA